MFSTIQTRAGALGALALFQLAVFGCASPDPEASFNAFGERVVARDDVGEDTVEDTGGDDVVEDVTADGSGCDLPPVDPVGNYLLAVWVKAFPTKPPLLLEVAVTEGGTGYTFSFQPLTNDFDVDGNPAEDPRQPVGDPVIVPDVAVTDGAFELVANDIFIGGAANPITGRDIRASIELAGSWEHNNFVCGLVDGGATEPTPVSLRNSTFGMIRADDVTTIESVADDCEADVPPPACEGSGS